MAARRHVALYRDLSTGNADAATLKMLRILNRVAIGALD
jgi:hypothetical protein